MRFSQAIRKSVLRKVLPPENQSITNVSREMGVSLQTIRNWIMKAKNGIVDSSAGEMRPRDRGLKEKMLLVLEWRGLHDDTKGEWLRLNGLHEEYIPLWESELMQVMTEKQDHIRDELHCAKRKIKNLEKELHRKEKALAEMAALMILKKKAAEIWGGDEDA